MKIIDFDPRESILSALDKYYSYIAPTYGPAGKKILLSTGAIDDGKLASQEFELPDEHENHIVSFIKETTSKTDDRVGDGTTTAAILMSSIVRLLLTPKDEFSKPINTHAEVISLRKGLVEAIAQIKKSSKKVKTKEDLYRIAHNSYNNEEIARVISDTVFKIGEQGSLSVHDSKSMNTECEITSGLEIEKGFISPYLINSDDRVSLDNPLILLFAQKVDSFSDLVPAIKLVLESGRKEFVVIAEGFGEDAIGGIIMNKLKGTFSPLLIEAPGYGAKKSVLLKDIAAVVGAIVIDPKKGDSLAEVTSSSFGLAKQVIARKDTTIFVGGTGSKKGIADRITYIESVEKGDSKFEQMEAEKRIANLTGGVAIIRVGAATENEQRSIKAKVEDAVSATKMAFKHGIVLGGGKTFEAITTSSKTLNEALKAPRRVLEENGKEFLDDTVYDPTEVLVAALETAVSISCELLEISGIVSEKRKKERSVLDDSDW
jgi:chaperonin GroEL